MLNVNKKIKKKKGLDTLISVEEIGLMLE